MTKTAFATWNRRRVLALLGGFLALPAVARSTAGALVPADEIVIVDGWVLRASDLKMAALDAT